jgi:hypothetical protein
MYCCASECNPVLERDAAAAAAAATLFENWTCQYQKMLVKKWWYSSLSEVLVVLLQILLLSWWNNATSTLFENQLAFFTHFHWACRPGKIGCPSLWSYLIMTLWILRINTGDQLGQCTEFQDESNWTWSGAVHLTSGTCRAGTLKPKAWSCTTRMQLRRISLGSLNCSYAKKEIHRN